MREEILYNIVDAQGRVVIWYVAGEVAYQIIKNNHEWRAVLAD